MRWAQENQNFHNSSHCESSSNPAASSRLQGQGHYSAVEYVLSMYKAPSSIPEKRNLNWRAQV